ncbi:hypothetical protein OBBRIDRAFT_799399 [Obba rivulosa]|uniref:Uncharacterized protein n=1 Tax=Obba rivulosa TaxID=1052685 RepID=A0A8E2DEM7_9APHY|nr:hypothetical protein OBBRIDRAFT_799399 [Obba rivulosa]
MSIHGQKRRTLAAISWRTPCTRVHLMQPAEPHIFLVRVTFIQGMRSQSRCLPAVPCPSPNLISTRTGSGGGLGVQGILLEADDIQHTPLPRTVHSRANYELSWPSLLVLTGCVRVC